MSIEQKFPVNLSHWGTITYVNILKCCFKKIQCRRLKEGVSFTFKGSPHVFRNDIIIRL